MEKSHQQPGVLKACDKSVCEQRDRWEGKMIQRDFVGIRNATCL